MSQRFETIDARFAHVWQISRRHLLRALVVLGGAAPLVWRLGRAAAAECRTTSTTPIEGPYFFADPEERATTGTGVRIAGVVRDAASCEPIRGARIVRWHSNRTGLYEDYYRAVVSSDDVGAYALETIVPGIYAGLARHVHFHVTAPGYRDLITQIQWQNSALPPADNSFDFALERL